LVGVQLFFPDVKREANEPPNDGALPRQGVGE
jgi:hypothetical protein